jgi:hypothetical protein
MKVEKKFIAAQGMCHIWDYIKKSVIVHYFETFIFKIVDLFYDLT